MKRGGFTMIELIFVIVILGILAAVAIPKLAATRDDAKIAKASSELSTLLSDMGSYYTANGELNGSTSAFTNVVLSSNTITYGTPISYEYPTGSDCIDINVSSNGDVAFSTASTSDSVCEGIQQVAASNNLIKTHSFGGTRVKW